MKEAKAILTEQWPPQQTIRMSKEEYLEMVSKALRGIKRTGDIDVEDIQRRIEEQYTLIEDMQRWLDKFLKN